MEEDETEDELLAKALEESLRHYLEVEEPLRQNKHLDEPAGKPKGIQDGASCSSETDIFIHQPQLPSRSVLYNSEDAYGFDLSAGRTWIYPTNYPVRQYQFNIVKSCLFKNTLVSLPTGLGKTFIAAVLMYNFYRWFPRGKVIFMAPTKPLVNQQIDSCYKVMGIPRDDTAEMTGSMSPAERSVAWERKRVFFLTPQVLTNDLTRGACPAADIKCIVIDEAHKALGNQAYCQVIKALLPFNDKFRVLALSATPGSDMQAVVQIVKNLLISHIELRSEDSPEIKEFTHKRNVETVVVSLDTYLLSVQKRFMLILDKYVSYLQKQKVLFGSMNSLAQFVVLKAREMFRENPPSHITPVQRGIIEANFAVSITLLHSLELLSLHGLRSFLKFLHGVLYENRGTPVVQAQLKCEQELETLLEELREKLGPDNEAEPEPDQSMIVPASVQEPMLYVYSHPKVEKLQEVVVNHFTNFQVKNVATRAMIFCQYRDIVIEVCHILQKHRPLVKPMTFVGQSTGKQSKGFTQKQQLKVVNKFKSGGYNTLICTCVGEEGLDIGEVDLIVCFDAQKSPIRLVQRMGRTGRQREGRIVMLVTEGKEHSKYKASVYQNNTMNKKLLEGNQLMIHMYKNNPRMIPQDVNPQCHQIHITVPTIESKQTNQKRQKNQDIRKLLVNSTSNKRVGAKRNEDSSPYCTAEDLAEFWDGKTVPEFSMLPDLEELHAKGRSELLQVFNRCPLSTSNKESQKLDPRKWIEWQRDLQPTMLVQHSDDSRILTELLQYADNKRFQMQPTQTAELLSQVNASMMWPKKSSKGKHSLKAKVISNSTKTGKKNRLIKKRKKSELVTSQYKGVQISPETDGEGNCISDHFKPMGSAKKRKICFSEQVIVISDSSNEVANYSVTQTMGKMKTLSVKRDVNDNDLCYFCKNNFLHCQHVIPCESSETRDSGESESFEPLNVSVLNNFNKTNLAKFDLHKLLSPVDDVCDISHNTDKNIYSPCANKQQMCESTELKSQKDEEVLKINFDLDFSQFATFFQEEIDPENINGGELQPSVVDERTVFDAVEIQTNTEFCHNNKISAVLKPAEIDNSIVVRNSSQSIHDMTKEFSPNCRVTSAQKSPDVSPFNDVQNKCIENTPLKDRLVKRCLDSNSASHKEGQTNTSNFLMFPVSPILRSTVKILESPILGSQFKNRVHKPMRTIPTCSTPKVHKKNLFSGMAMLDNKQEEEKGNKDDKEDSFTSHHLNNLRDIDMLEKTVNDYEEKEESEPVSEIPNFPKPNFDLLSATQWIENILLAEDQDNVKSSARKESSYVNTTNITHNSTMCTVTQLVNMVDEDTSEKEGKAFRRSIKNNTDIDLESAVLPDEPILVPSSTKKGNRSLQKHPLSSSVVSNKFIEEIERTPQKVGKYNLTNNINEESTSCIPNFMFQVSPILGSLDKSNFSPVQEILTEDEKKSDYEYLLESDDDIFAGLAVDKLGKHSKSTTSAKKEVCRSNSIPDFENVMNQHVSSNKDTTLHDGNVHTGIGDKNKEITCKTSISDCDSPIIKPRVRNRRTNISSTSNESPVSCPQNKSDPFITIGDEICNEQDWFANRKSNTETSALSKDINAILASDMKKKNTDKKSVRNFEMPVDTEAIVISSDDDFESQTLERQKTKIADKTSKNEREVKISRVNKNTKPRCIFVDAEAEESDSCPSSSDGENTSGLDEYDTSFVSDSGNQTHTDIQAKYLHSIIRNPGCQQGQFKIPEKMPVVPLQDVFSQEDVESETSYMEDSFCVDEETFAEIDEASVLEVAEAFIEAKSKWKRRKRKRLGISSGSDSSDCGKETRNDKSSEKLGAIRNKKRRRIMNFESSESENNEDVNKSTCNVQQTQVKNQILLSSNKRQTENINISNKQDTGTTNIPVPKAEFLCQTTVNSTSSHTRCLSNRACSSTSQTATAENECMGIDFGDWDDDNFEYPDSEQVFEEQQNNKRLYECKQKDTTHIKSVTENVLSSPLKEMDDLTSPVLTCSGRSRQSYSKVVRSLNSEFERGRTPSLLSDSSSGCRKAMLSTDKSLLQSAANNAAVIVPSISGLSNNSKQIIFNKTTATVFEECKSSTKTVIMSTRQVASAPEIATALRAVHNINVLVKSFTDADYVVSHQLGVLRITMSDFVRACPNKSGLSKAVGLLRVGYMQRVLVVENDKQIPVALSAGTHREIWNKSTATQLAYLRSAGVSVLFSCSKADTAHLLTMLTRSECEQNRGIISLPKHAPSLENLVQFYHNLPGVNIALAIRLCHIFTNVMDFIDSCSSMKNIQEVLDLDAERAVQIHLVLHRTMKS